MKVLGACCAVPCYSFVSKLPQYNASLTRYLQTTWMPLLRMKVKADVMLVLSLDDSLQTSGVMLRHLAAGLRSLSIGVTDCSL